MKERTKTILGIDGWTHGYHHFERLVPELSKLGYRMVLIHVGSWGHDLNRPAEETLGLLKVRDISYYRKKSIREILELENPCLVLFLSISFAHMAFNRYAQALQIPTCHLYHGLVSVQAVSNNEQSSRVSFVRQLYLLITRSRKNITKILPIYAKALITTKAGYGLWDDFFRELIVKIRGKRRAGRIILGGRTTAGCVYTQADVSHMRDNYGVNEENIYVVGNPDLISFGLTSADLGSELDSARNSKEAIYIDTCYLAAGAHFRNENDFINHILDIRDSLGLQGLNFKVKLHPAHYLTSVPVKLEQRGVILVENREFVETVRRSMFAIVEPSTAAMVPALIGIPVLLCKIGRLAGKQYGRVLTSYPRSFDFNNFDDLPFIVNSFEATKETALFDKWVENNVGPLPASDMPYRVAKVLDGIVNHRFSNN